MKRNELIVDAVITWVDGKDKKWQKKFNNYSDVKINWNNKKDTVRYNSIEEINIAIKTIIKFSPFIRNIYLVSDNQKPNGFEELVKLAKKSNINLILIDHKVIFKDFENCLPTFNSCSIITMLFRIPDLAEHFIIFNDDTFLMRKTKINDFFINGFPVIRGSWRSFYENQLLRKNYYKFINYVKIGTVKNGEGGYKKAQQKSAKMLGLKKYIKRDHTPVPLRKSTIHNYFAKNPDLLEQNVKYRFRDKSQFIISSMSNHLEAQNSTFYLKKSSQLTYFQSYTFVKVFYKLIYFSVNKKKLFMCFQNLEIASEKQLNFILKWIDNKLSA